MEVLDHLVRSSSKRSLARFEMIKIAFVTFLLMAFYGTPRCMAQPPITFPAVTPGQIVVAPAYRVVAPQTILVPQVQMIPYQLQRVEVQPRFYSTPVRNWLWGRYRINSIYAPQVPQ